MSRPHPPAVALAVLLAAAGTTHFARPTFYDPMIPPQLPGAPRTWTYGSGAAELAVAVAVAVPRTRRIGALAAVGLFAAVFPANVQMAVNAFRRDRPAQEKVASLVRLPLQGPLIRWAWRVSRTAAVN